MADFLNKAAEWAKNTYEKGKKMKQEKLSDRELEHTTKELEELRDEVGTRPLDKLLGELKNAFMVDLDEVNVKDPKKRAKYWAYMNERVMGMVAEIKEGRIESFDEKKEMDQLVKDSTHARLQEIISAKDPEKEGKSVFTEIANKFPGGKKGLAAGFSLLSILGIKKDSTLGKFIAYIKGLFGIEDEKKKEKVPALAPEKIRKMADKAKPPIAEYRKAVPKDDISKRNTFFKSKNIAPYPANRNEKGFSYEGYYASSLLIKEYSIKANTKESRGLEEAIKIAKTELTGAKKAPEKGPTLSGKTKEMTDLFSKAGLSLDAGNINADLRFLDQNRGTEKLKPDKRVEKGLKKGSNLRKTAEVIKGVLKDKPFKFRLLDIRLDQYSDNQLNKLHKGIKDKIDPDPKTLRRFLDKLNKEPAKLTKLIKDFEKTT